MVKKPNTRRLIQVAESDSPQREKLDRRLCRLDEQASSLEEQAEYAEKEAQIRKRITEARNKIGSAKPRSTFDFDFVRDHKRLLIGVGIATVFIILLARTCGGGG